jgi:putative transposase
MDAIWLPTRPQGAKEGVLCAWGISVTGERVLLAVMLGMRESQKDWTALARDLTGRGLQCPQLIVSDGSPGLITTIEQCWPGADRQRCTVHRLRNLLAKLPEAERERVRSAYWQILDDAQSIAEGEQGMRALIGQLTDHGYHAAAACLADDLPALLVGLSYPLRHRRKSRSTNLLERSLGEVRRRTKVISRFPGEQSCLSLCWARLVRLLRNAAPKKPETLDPTGRAPRSQPVTAPTKTSQAP